MRIKLICIDMDGTLLNNNHEVTRENKIALKRARDMGITIAITTGRLFCSARYYADLLGIDAPVIASNGSYIKNKYNDTAILENPLPKDIAIEIYKTIKEFGLSVNFNSWNTLIREDEVPREHAYSLMNDDLPDDMKVKFLINPDSISAINNFDGQILKGIVIENINKDKLWACKKALKEKFSDKLHIVSSGDNNFEIMLGNSSKGNAVKFLANSLKISSDEVMCIGDSENDLSMIKFAGVGVAMGNALDLLKKEADFITDTNVNSGVAKALYKFVLN